MTPIASQTTAELPDLFLSISGHRITSPDEWPSRRAEILKTAVDLCYGGLPPTPPKIEVELLHQYPVRLLDGANHAQYRLLYGDSNRFSFILKLWIPVGEGPFPVLLYGDGCWNMRTDEITREVLQRGYILAEFNRTEIVPDNGDGSRNTGLYLAYPGQNFGALSAWAWGYHRCIDYLVTREDVRPDQIAITGHSRGGKAALLAGATDERIALTVPNNSGCGGAGSYRWQGPGCETLHTILRAVPYWFGSELAAYIDREAALPFDSHSFQALVAPRALLITEAQDDPWANPSGAQQAYRAAREVYKFLGVEDQIGFRLREGEHAHTLADWQVCLDFADWKFRGKTPKGSFDTNPYSDLPPAFTWSAPSQTAL